MDEVKRLRAVSATTYRIPVPINAYDRITALAARLFKVPIAIVYVVYTNRIRFKSPHELDATETGQG
jgi:hypothetical protein